MNAQQGSLTGTPTVRLPWGHGADYREVRTCERLTRDGTPLVLLTESPDSDVALATLGGVWPWHLLCEHIRVPVLTGCPAGITVEALDADGRRLLVTGPGGRMIIERVSRSRR